MAAEGETKVEDYGIFTDAISTVDSFNKNIKEEYTTIKKNITAIDDEGVFFFLFADSIVSESEAIREKIKHSYGNFKTMSKKLGVISANYEAGDDAASRQILAIKDGKVGLQKVAAYIKTGNKVQDDAYSYLKKKGYSDAAICGILANMEYESGYNTEAIGDHGTSYGLFQWRLGRRDNLEAYCKEHNLDVNSVEGQMGFALQEVESYPELKKCIEEGPNTKENAYKIAEYWTRDFERPADPDGQSQARGSAAQSKYWDIYGPK